MGAWVSSFRLSRRCRCAIWSAARVTYLFLSGTFGISIYRRGGALSSAPSHSSLFETPRDSNDTSPLAKRKHSLIRFSGMPNRISAAVRAAPQHCVQCWASLLRATSIGTEVKWYCCRARLLESRAGNTPSGQCICDSTIKLEDVSGLNY
jgi:hypothetical protein